MNLQMGSFWAFTAQFNKQTQSLFYNHTRAFCALVVIFVYTDRGSQMHHSRKCCTTERQIFLVKLDFLFALKAYPCKIKFYTFVSASQEQHQIYWKWAAVLKSVYWGCVWSVQTVKKVLAAREHLQRIIQDPQVTKTVLETWVYVYLLNLGDKLCVFYCIE